jgi:putative CocE/NonD family hydrolase
MDWFVGDDAHRNGALCLDMFEFFAGFFGPETNYPATATAKPYDFGTPDGYRFYLQMGSPGHLKTLDKRKQSPFLARLLDHPNYDAFWQTRNLRPHLKDVHPAVLTVGGWYDGEDMFGALHCFKSIDRQSPGTHNHLVMGPWFHGQWAAGDASSLGEGDWGQNTGKEYREQVEKPFFDHYLLGTPDPRLPKAFVFEVGTNRWRRFDTWPPTGTRTVAFYFRGNGVLSTSKPSRAAGYDEFISDPAHPVPYKDDISTYHTTTYLVDDQRFASTRPDVLVYESAPLEQDLTMAGPIRADLEVSTSGTDSDWVVKVIDEHPGNEPDPLPNPNGYRNGGWQELVRADVMRGRFRKSFEHPSPFVPGRPTHVAWELNDVLHTFKKGHRIMVQVQCSWFPLVDRNPQTFVDINSAKPSDYRKATQRVYRNAEAPSRIEVGVLQP